VTGDRRTLSLTTSTLAARAASGANGSVCLPSR
jgi:hypothetical protein